MTTESKSLDNNPRCIIQIKQEISKNCLESQYHVMFFVQSRRVNATETPLSGVQAVQESEALLPEVWPYAALKRGMLFLGRICQGERKTDLLLRVNSVLVNHAFHLPAGI